MRAMDARGVTCYRTAFSLVELVIVVVIIGIVGAIAVPRLSSASERAKTGSLTANIAVLTKCIEHYIAEHGDLSPADNPGSPGSASGALFAERLVGRTDGNGLVIPGGPFGPYLREVPPNPYNRRRTIRIDGVAPGANLAGWRWSTTKRLIDADHAGSGGVLEPTQMPIEMVGSGG
jgi:prepilin-type N-terminal cleavage/methylation domain-containing protein